MRKIIINYEKNASIVVSGDFKLCKGAKGVYPNINLYNLISINMISYNFTIWNFVNI